MSTVNQLRLDWVKLGRSQERPVQTFPTMSEDPAQKGIMSTAHQTLRKPETKPPFPQEPQGPGIGPSPRGLVGLEAEPDLSDLLPL